MAESNKKNGSESYIKVWYNKNIGTENTESIVIYKLKKELSHTLRNKKLCREIR